MTDLFDLSNLITTAGVEGVKIKSEPGLPEKSSTEILSELFSTFDAPEDGAASPESSDQQVPNGSAKSAKKRKKKHKHKEKKHKKRSRHNSSDSNSDAEGVKKKKKHKKRSKRRRESVSSKSSDSGQTKVKLTKLDDDMNLASVHDEESKTFDIMSKKESMNEVSKLENQNLCINKDPDIVDKIVDGSGSPRLPPILKKTDDEFDEPIMPKLLEKPKQSSQGKILIKDLKNSTVYSETVKEIENKQKAKAARMEDGELSDSSSDDNRTPTLSPPPVQGRSPSFSPSREKMRNKMFSPSRKAISTKTDLRLVLREKEKKKSVRERDNKRSRSCHSQDRKRSRSRTRQDSYRSRSGGREKQRGRSKERRDSDKNYERRDSGRSRERRRHRSRSENRSRDKHTRGRSRSRERKERIEIDKKKLLEIARRNAINMIKQGTLPLAQQDKAIAAIQSGGKTVDELTDFCKSLSKSEALGELSSISSEGEESESEKGFHHPFLLKERPSSIIMNIRDAKQLPTKTFQEKTAETSNQLRLQFPVSSGQHHRRSENEWVPVTPKKPEPKKIFVPASTNESPFTIPPSPVSEQAPPPVQPVQSVQPVQPVQPVQTVQTVFPTITKPVDIGSIVSERLAAMRKLTENPNDVGALNAMHRAQNEMRTWAESKQIPGQFTGSTGVRVLTPAELASGYQAWARKASIEIMSSCEITANYHQLPTIGFHQKPIYLIKLGYLAIVCIHLRVCYRHIATSEKKQLRQPDAEIIIYWDQLVSAQPVSGGMGMALLQKMGWRPGEGLGKNKEGALEPLQLEVKLDKRGLVSEQDIGQKIGKTLKPIVPAVKTLEGKHPVSLLGEYCSKKKLGAPVYELCFECGPDHRKNFLFKVKVNGIEYKPSVASPNKKQAKAEAAQICLQSLGLLPS